MANNKKPEKVISADKIAARKLIRENRTKRILAKKANSVFSRAIAEGIVTTKAQFRNLIKLKRADNRRISQRIAVGL